MDQGARVKYRLKKSIGFVVPAQFRHVKIPGQVPRIDPALTAMPKRRMILAPSTPRCFTPERVVEGLPLAPDWARHVAKAMSAPNELLMRQDLFSRMHEERMHPDLRRVLFERSLSLWREQGRMAKSDPKGGTYIKRVPRPGGGWRYFYDEDKYNAHDGAHVSGPDAAKAAITKAVDGHIKAAGKNGCELSTFKPLVKRYGAEMVGGFLNEACAGGSLVYKGKRLFAKMVAKVQPKLSQSSANPQPIRSQPAAKPQPGVPKKPKGEISEKPATKKSGYFFVEPLVKAGPHRYTHRAPKPEGTPPDSDGQDGR